MRSRKAHIRIISPAKKNANNGNWHTALRWSRFLKDTCDVAIATEWTPSKNDVAPDALVALHARRSAASIARFAAHYPGRPLIVVLTGTDLYRDIAADAAAQRSLALASHLVVLQQEGIAALPEPLRAKCRVIFQSATTLRSGVPNRTRFDIVLVGHMRAEKDPLTPMRSLEVVPAGLPVRLIHIGNALEEKYLHAARELMARNANYQWLGGLPRGQTRQRIKRARVMVISSLMEGGANVVIEAVTAGVPVMASAIAGNIGMLGRDYAGYFPVGDAEALAALIARCRDDADFLAQLLRQCARRAPLFAPAREKREVIKMISSCTKRPQLP